MPLIISFYWRFRFFPWCYMQEIDSSRRNIELLMHILGQGSQGDKIFQGL